MHRSIYLYIDIADPCINAYQCLTGFWRSYCKGGILPRICFVQADGIYAFTAKAQTRFYVQMHRPK